MNSYLEKTTLDKKRLRKRWENLKEKLEWPNSTSQSPIPSILWLAKKTGERKIYDYIYFASSRFVHFSTHELMRRCWGDPSTESMSINSSKFNDYWGHFSLYWGYKLFLRTVILIDEIDQFQDVMTKKDREMFYEANTCVVKSGRPPIITKGELFFPYT